ncbi:MarR family winged helix-turn-helix transcriptional regulator [Tellurirhabdus bombi]|uniref:MarR family winged helix-turn-helix transcriptional regulator n=1 Tax=Tellurirhabdus bombi TaxID=2907205 RepID=UPI001F421AA4|nr:MarR family transcriptional regulator [Tellurirhabdus bombi]
MNKDFIDEMEELGITSRLRRVSDAMSHAANSFYKGTGIDFEARWFSVFYLIASKGPMGVTEIADLLSITHPAVIQVTKELENRNLISSTACVKDCRKRLLAITAEGQERIQQIKPLINAFREVNQQLLNAQSCNLLLALREFEDQLETKSYSRRLQEVLTHSL